MGRTDRGYEDQKLLAFSSRYTTAAGQAHFFTGEKKGLAKQDLS
jgi:hypothetical protein